MSSRLSPRETICMNCQSLFSGEEKNKKYKKTVFSLSSAELAHRVVKVKGVQF